MVTFLICAFGPSAVTKASCRRVLALAGPTDRVVAFRSNRLAEVPSPGLEPGLVVVEGAGTRALHTALDQAGEQTVVFLHDDVLLTRTALDRLLAETGRSNQMCVPYSNDEGVPHSVGPLPPVHAGADGLRRAAREVAKRRMTTARTRATCIVGPAAGLRALADRGLHRARLLISAPMEPFIVPARAVVSHDGGCSQRLAAPVGPEGKPLLVASMIVRDEERMLPECLASLAGLVDRIDICDTGSSDRTIEMAKELGATVIQREWRNDFSWARNEALAMSRDAWYVLQIDADERVRCADPAAIRQRLATAVDDEDAYTLAIHNLEVTGNSKTVHHAPRLFRPAGMSYVSALHETPRAITGPEPVWTDLQGLHLDHYGYDRGVVTGKEKLARNLAIAKADYERARQPSSARHYARALAMTGGDPAEIIQLFGEALADRLGPAVRAMTLTGLAEAYLKSNRPEDALESTREARRLVPGDSWAAAVHARAALRLGLAAEVLDMAASSASASSVDAAFSSDDYAREARILQATACAQVGRVEDALALAGDLLATAPAVESDDFVAFLRAILGDRRANMIPQLQDLAALDPTGSVFRLLAEVLTPAEVVEVCLPCARSSSAPQEAVRVGIVAALTTRDWISAAKLVARVEVLDATARSELAVHLEQRGLVAAAAVIRTGQLTPCAAWDIRSDLLGQQDLDTLATVLAITDAAVVSVPVTFEPVPGMPVVRWLAVARRDDAVGDGQARLWLPTQAAPPARVEDPLLARLAAGAAADVVDDLARLVPSGSDEDRAVLLRWLAIALFERGDDTEATSLVEQALAVYPAYTDLWYLRWLFTAVTGREDREAAGRVAALGPARTFPEHLADPAALMADRLAPAPV